MAEIWLRNGDENSPTPVNDFNAFPVKIVPPPGVAPFYVAGDTGAMTGTSATTVIAAPSAGFHLEIAQLTATNNHATVATAIAITGLDDGKGGSVTYHVAAAAVSGCVALTFNPPLRCRDNTALTATDITNGANAFVSASGNIVASGQ